MPPPRRSLQIHARRAVAIVATLLVVTACAAEPGGDPARAASPATATAAAAPPTTVPPTTVPPTTVPPTTVPPTTVPPTAAPPGTGAPWFGVLQSTAALEPVLRGAGVSVAVLEVGWNHWEPQRGQFAGSYAIEMRARHQQLRAQGFDVILDPGLQYPPGWVFDLGPGTRFRNQHGDDFHGPLGSDVPNAVFHHGVRAAQAAYLSELGAAFEGLDLLAVRTGGLAMNELRYPEPAYAGRDNSFWAFDEAALAASPVPGWRPGEPCTTEAATFVEWYTDSLTSYGVWLAQQLRGAFPAPELQVLAASWGLRPGERDDAATTCLSGTSRAELTGGLNMGLDWDRQLPALAQVPGIVAYSTWLDAPDQGDSSTYMSPVRYLHQLATPLGVPVAGENTGRGTVADLALSRSRVDELGLQGMMWMAQPDLLAGPPLASLDDVAAHLR